MFFLLSDKCAMAGLYSPSFLGSTADNGFVSGLSGRQSVRNRLQELEDDDVQEDKIEDPPLSPHQGENSPLRGQSYPPSVREPRCPPGPESHSSRTLDDTQTLISKYHVVDKDSGTPIGQHSLVSMAKKAFWQQRPPIPRYHATYDVSVILRHIENLGQNESLTLKS